MCKHILCNKIHRTMCIRLALNATVVLWLMLVGSLLFVIAGVFMVYHSAENQLIGWAGIIFFGLCAFAFIKMIKAKDT